MPSFHRVHRSNTLFAFFDGLIPEGWLLDIAKDHWKVNRNDRFELLLLTCRDAIGAVSVVPVEENVV
ncbi:HipA N-terminal domain-containing protein [Pseudoflavitalea rhizosphaerae]|uniref:HipA N-terminal domain-containing protein n=1 Tax=Pseudoflavitalea rhizosphaerae TaxID=1884793 RepID=UPI000F8DF898|nr:HipA N-terminal domain-containing protein [Pseudoflavitalea rhizosphaerae]